MTRVFVVLFCMLIAFAAVAATVEEIAARVGNEIITKSELEKAQNRLHADLSKRMEGEELEKQFAEQKAQILEYLVNQKLLEQKAKELDLNVEEEVNAAVKRLREENNIEDDAALEAALQKEGSSAAQLREDFRKRIIQQRILWNYVQGKVNITEDEIKNYYEQHKSEMMTEPVTKIHRYVITDPSIEKGVLSAEAKSLVNSLRTGKEIKKEDFPHLKESESTEFAQSEIDPRLAEILNQTPAGSTTDPLETGEGWLVLKVEERKDAKPVSLEEARGKIYNFLLQERAEKYQKSFLEDLRKQSYVVVNPNYS